MTLVCISPEKIIFNELKALFFIDKNQFDIAEGLLLKNIEERTDSILTYNLLIKVYIEKNDYNGLLMTLNNGIKSTVEKDFYRKIKKQVILSRIIKDIKCAQGGTNSHVIN